MSIENIDINVLYLSIIVLLFALQYSIKNIKYFCTLYPILFGFMLFTQVFFIAIEYFHLSKIFINFNNLTYDLVFLLIPIILVSCKKSEKKKGKMPYKHLNDTPEFNTLFVLFLGIWGAIMNYIKRKNDNYNIFKKMGLFILDVITSGGIAIITYLVVYGYTGNEYLSVGISGVFAHLGTRAFYIFEQVISQKLNIKL